MASTRHRGWLKSRPNLVFLKNKIIGKVTSKAVFKPYVFAAFFRRLLWGQGYWQT